jgi:hypothetical protein
MTDWCLGRSIWSVGFEVVVLRPQKARAQDDKFSFWVNFDARKGDYS